MGSSTSSVRCRSPKLVLEVFVGQVKLGVQKGTGMGASEEMGWNWEPMCAGKD